MVTGCTREDEKVLHAVMADKRIRGEWYNCQLAAGLAEEASSGMDRHLLYKSLRRRIGGKTPEARNILRSISRADADIYPNKIIPSEVCA